MKLSQLSLTIAAGLIATTVARAQTESFDGGSNDGTWVAWFDAYNAVEPTGGNPDWFLHLDNFTTGPSSCQYVDIFQTTWPNSFSGNYRALGVGSIGLDVNIVEGAYGGEWSVTLCSDPGTPSDDTDDSKVQWLSAQPPPGGAGWRAYDFPIDTSSMTLPLGWTPTNGCFGMTGDDCWNHIIENVDYIEFRMDSDPTAFCNFTNWDFGIDNIRIAVGDVGSNYCTSSANSTGAAAVITASGTNSVGDNALSLHAGPVPNQPGLFYYGPNQIQLTFGNGTRCVGGNVGRLGVVIPVANEYSSLIDNTNPPSAATQITSGSTWNFQCWYRDPAAGGAFFDLSDGLSITFAP
ncbi:MAG: hypothetical protein ACI841_000415 [Planctomycetota bacterium]|jgi:hypothetical protein